MDRRTVGRGTLRPVLRGRAPIAFSDSESHVDAVVLLTMLGASAVLLLLGLGVTPARAARWPAARLLEEQGNLFVTTGLAFLAACAVVLLLFLIAPA